MGQEYNENKFSCSHIIQRAWCTNGYLFILGKHMKLFCDIKHVTWQQMQKKHEQGMTSGKVGDEMKSKMKTIEIYLK
jgi:hypothetical protein